MKTVSVVTEQTGSDKGRARNRAREAHWWLHWGYVGWRRAACLQRSTCTCSLVWRPSDAFKWPRSRRPGKQKLLSGPRKGERKRSKSEVQRCEGNCFKGLLGIVPSPSLAGTEGLKCQFLREGAFTDSLPSVFSWLIPEHSTGSLLFLCCSAHS